MWQILRFDTGDVAGTVFGNGLSESEAKEYVEILDRRYDGTGTIFFAEPMDS